MGKGPILDLLIHGLRARNSGSMDWSFEVIRRNISDHFVDLGLEVRKDGRHDDDDTSRVTSISGCNKGINTRLDIWEESVYVNI